MSGALAAHLATGATHVCTCWAVTRRDGFTLGFTDHDQSICFDDIDFLPQNGLSSRALASTTGLSVNNTEALGVLQSDAITEADIEAGRYDNAEVTIWRVQWDDPEARQIRFVGHIGEITRQAGSFQAELRGLTDTLNQPQGRSYLRNCSAVLGDMRCGVDLDNPAYSIDVVVADVEDRQVLRFANLPPFAGQWFESGFYEISTGEAQGLRGAIKRDEIIGEVREITLWQPVRAEIGTGDTIKLIAGCDKRPETCRVKFGNFLNFQGFPEIPGDDWLVSVPRSDGRNTGRSRIR